MKKQLQIAAPESWPIEATKPFIISGPCSAETPDQLMDTALRLARTGKVSLLRAGIWKPRTRPGSFQGIGEPALQWLIEAGQAAKLPVTTEVANAQHAEAALKAGVDVLWIGARTTVNPFSVQEIADVLQGVDIPVIVKNPINPDLDLWIGALERFHLSGITKLMAMHRGFAGVNSGVYRNAPLWEIPIALKAQYPQLPIICDPSHIAGKRDLLAGIAQKALDLDMYGLMIETHPDPDKAWSDAAQQVTPERFHEILSSLHLRTTGSTHHGIDAMLELRKRIDEIDKHLLHALAERMTIVRRIGEHKKEKDITILQLERWREILETRVELANDLGLSEEFVIKMLELIHKASIKAQSNIMNKEDEDEVMW